MEHSHDDSQTIAARKPIQFLKLSEVMRRVGLKHSTIYKRVAEGAFPRPVSLGGRAVAWVEQEVEKWMLERMRER